MTAVNSEIKEANNITIFKEKWGNSIISDNTAHTIIFTSYKTIHIN